ncbi:hypothetical protein [Paraburkholderia agricolaris]|uniref:hypothetical protein n=1 Tax=Paraburkholderia agricolaris TaxID=2152888 RepID=UPI0012910514|nr:hypothetical protein [Paraburkholderia agricolaris]
MNMFRAFAPPTQGSVTVVESGAFIVKGNHSQVPICDGLDIQTGLLHEFCFTEISPLSRDLSVLLGAVKYVDRSVRRKHGRGWERHLSLTVPVYEIATWRRDDVASTLMDTLQYLTGDVWQVRFVKRRRISAPSGQMSLPASPDRRRVFVPFSHGLDSFAQSELLRASEIGFDVIPVHLRSSAVEQTMKSLGRSAKRKPTPIPVSSNVNEPKHAEPSFRTRPFLFDGLAAYAAVLSEGGEVVIPENGQGSLGGSLVRLGAEAPHRSCHPGFTTRLAHFFDCLTGKKVTFVHPALFHTKGQVLRSLLQVQPDSVAWLAEHPSCSYDARHANRGGKKVHCGVCGNCLLRRTSILAAGIVDSTDYKVSDLHAKSLEEAIVADDKLLTLGSYKDIARNAARSMQRLADLSSSDKQYRVAAEAEGLASYQRRSRSEVRDALDGMLEQHSHEWMDFLGHCGKSSWVALLARE